MTFRDIDTVHERPEGTARKRFADNKDRFTLGKHYFVLYPKDLENTELSEKRTLEKCVLSNRGTTLITEKGYLLLVKSFTDDLAWKVQEDLIDTYFNVHEILSTELSPELQMLQGLLNQMVQKEIADKKRDKQIALAQKTADKAVKTTEDIKEAVKPIFDDWRSGINSKFNRIQKNTDRAFSLLRTEMYSELEKRAGCDLGTRLRNKQKRMEDNGRTKSEINNLNKMDIIEEDKKLREIFSKIVTEYEIKYCT